MDEKRDFLFRAQFLLLSKIRRSIATNIMTAQIHTDSISKITGLVALAIIGMMIAVPIVVFLFMHSVIFAVITIPFIYFGASVLIDSVFSEISDSVATGIEKVLPDMLLLMSANLRAGMIPENSFLASIKPEFGKLNYLLSSAAIEVQGGKDFSEALMDISYKTSSLFFKDTIERTINVSQKISNKLEVYSGLTTEEMKKDINEKVSVLKWMIRKKTNSVNKIGLITSNYYMNNDRLLGVIASDEEPDVLETS